MSKTLLIVAALLVTASTSVVAQQRSGTPQEQQACSSSVNRYCRSVMDQGDFVVLACLQQNRQKISPACQKVLRDNGQ